jgi:hypothetical protein
LPAAPDAGVKIRRSSVASLGVPLVLRLTVPIVAPLSSLTADVKLCSATAL